MRLKKIEVGFLAIALSFVVFARADDWPAAVVKEEFSASRDWFVRVIPGESLGDTVGFEGARQGPYAKAEFYQRQWDRSYRLEKEVVLSNPVAPVRFLVTDRGYLVTLDNWHNMGHGKVIVSYSPEGQLVSAYELKELFSGQEVSKFRHSESSIWWREETAYVRLGQQSVYVKLEEDGAELILEAETGAWQYCELRGQTHLCRNSNAKRNWRAFREPELRP